MRSNYITDLLVTIGFIGFLLLCADCESMNSFLLSKFVGIFLILTAYGLSKLLKSHINIKHHK